MAGSEAPGTRYVQIWAIRFLLTLSTSGSFTLNAMKQIGKKRIRPKVRLSDSSASQAVNFAAYEPTSEWLHGSHVVSAALDDCAVGSWIFADSPVNVRHD